MLKLKLQYFGHLMQRTNLLEKTLMLGKIEGRRRRGWQKMRWLDVIIDQWTWVWVNSRSWWWTGRPGVLQSMGSQRVRHDWATELNWRLNLWAFFPHLTPRSLAAWLIFFQGHKSHLKEILPTQKRLKDSDIRDFIMLTTQPDHRSMKPTFSNSLPHPQQTFQSAFWGPSFFKKEIFIYSFGYTGLSCSMWDLVPWPGCEPRSAALRAQS